MALRYIACVVGARPNFMKIAPLLRVLGKYPDIHPILVHTGQHYDENLSETFFKDLGIRPPDASLEVGSGSHGMQTAKALERFEAFLLRRTPNGKPFDRVVVVGDVNSTLAASLAAVKLGIPVAHIEAGLRSFDRAMPEEINRVITDALSDLLLVTEPMGIENLRREGHDDAQLHLVGNIMIDTLLDMLPRAKEQPILQKYGLCAGQYGVVTLHRPANVDVPEVLAGLIDVLVKISDDIPLVFSVHPRTRKQIETLGLAQRVANASNLLGLPPLGYLDFLALTSQAKVIVTDSGGLQGESTALGIPCLTVRSNTEQPITIDVGTCTLVGNDQAKLKSCLQSVLNGTYKIGQCPELWDGHAADRIARVVVEN